MRRKRDRRPGRPGGYTLVELLAVLGIAGVLACVAVPALGALSRNERRTAVVNELLVTLLAARSEALKRGGRQIVVCGIVDPAQPLAGQTCAGQDWTRGWALGTWNDLDADARVDPAEFRALRMFQPGTGGGLRVRAGNFMATPPVAPAGTLVVKSFGKRSSNGTITICDDRGPGAARAVIVSSLARARVSSKKADGSPLQCP
jgi:prepilin-type N-terminal cleavage/methylation domain-containing protein